MSSLQTLADITTAEWLALALIFLAWFGIGWLVEHPPRARPSVTILMQAYRRDWMHTFITRTPRLFDVSLIASLRQGTTFFASASMLALGGGSAMIGNSGAMRELAADLPIATGHIDLALKMLLPMAFLANALLKFIWAHRLFGYCAILMAAVPNDPDHPEAMHRAEQAADINGTAAKSYNRGLRAIYFALAGLAWILGEAALVLATLITSATLLRREFWSQSREVILDRRSE
ncbi:DUF599 domain-containing protein [Pseudogemmobacter faecipullorum]|uniref:DUF599 domain-containing protein n=1 Tax=Pseudogemmobacter faecipullorum TaxID=2755041 RepID=A0ABS8CNT1_9RHOB|nr:DUF599 domain-containing protein [Pseudogemmobacter faecipullorum]MCB5411011.1 DUF599 domain-containing protein [Pseudogemmobacter faecipullorum]